MLVPALCCCKGEGGAVYAVVRGRPKREKEAKESEQARLIGAAMVEDVCAQVMASRTALNSTSMMAWLRAPAAQA